MAYLDVSYLESVFFLIVEQFTPTAIKSILDFQNAVIFGPCAFRCVNI